MTLINLLEVEAQNLHSRINHNYWQSPYEDLPLSSSKFLKLLVETDIFRIFYAGVAKLVDVPDLGSGAVRRGGSIPFIRTKKARPRGRAFLLGLSRSTGLRILRFGG